MNEIGNKERIINILKKFESGLTYKNLLDQYRSEHNKDLENGYVYLKRLKQSGLIETYKPPYSKGKVITYKLVPEALKENDPITALKFLNNLFKNNIEYLIKNERIDQFIEKNEVMFNKIEKVIENA